MSDAAWILLSILGLFVLLPLFGPAVRLFCEVFPALKRRLGGEVAALIRMLSDDDPNVRRAAADTLADMGPKAKQAASALKELSQSDTDPIVREHALRAIVRIRSGTDED